jgi:hypothetical protein
MALRDYNALVDAMERDARRQEAPRRRSTSSSPRLS